MCADDQDPEGVEAFGAARLLREILSAERGIGSAEAPHGRAEYWQAYRETVLDWRYNITRGLHVQGIRACPYCAHLYRLTHYKRTRCSGCGRGVAAEHV